ncbi:MAG: PKD domain-containing protein [Bacteroidales bacterium]|nr:PKD domain-containing protein [Bacteroidales bacterium]
MKIRTSVLLLTFILTEGVIFTQEQPYTVTKSAFSTDMYDEFAPVFYKNGLVFCTDRGQAVSSQGQPVIKLFYADTLAGSNKSKPYSKDLKSKLNDGPATFNRTFDTIYYSRNLVIEGNFKLLSTYRNKLGLFYAVSEEKGWGKNREIRFNTEWFNITMPSLSHDGKRLYFASDKPDGLGGMDIYYSNWRNGYWEDPVNLGPAVNTVGNETYPFINETGELFFASDGHDGLGGKDVYVTRQKGNEWFKPVRLAPPINTEYDDYGIVTNPTMNEGYISSDRGGRSVDIYRFKSGIPQIWFAEPQKENLYCFSVSDTGNIQIEKERLEYVWDFGDDTRVSGNAAEHCFPGPGKYNIALDIKDRRTGSSYFRKQTYDIEIIDYNQPYITSSGYAVAGETVEFDAMKSYCPGYTITGFFWDMGDGTQKSGASARHKYTKSGEYMVRLGLTLREPASGTVLTRAVTKQIMVFDTQREMESMLAARPAPEKRVVDLRQFDNLIIKGQYSSEAEYLKEAVFQVEILSSKTKMGLSNAIFRSVPAKYTVREIHYPDAGIYSYVIDQQMSLMAAYPAWNEMVNGGFKAATIRLYVLTDPAERELNILKKNYGVMTDTYFDANNRLVTNAYLMLDQVVMMMNKYPGIKLEIGVHTDNQGVAGTLERLSQTRAQVIVNYLINRGVSASRLTAKGYGGSRPVAPNTDWLERRQNRRVEFSVMK